MQIFWHNVLKNFTANFLTDFFERFFDRLFDSFEGNWVFKYVKKGSLKKRLRIRTTADFAVSNNESKQRKKN